MANIAYFQASRLVVTLAVFIQSVISDKNIYKKIINN